MNRQLFSGVLAVAPILLLAEPAHACFFCDKGATATMYFVITVFGLFFLGMVMLFLAYWRAGAFKSSNQTELRVLEAEGIQERDQ